ncbi:MAG: hypothetical protein NC548_58945 [Lachnospiraceae bacterium]|nr:hypothetical protein [Lachnospiraceae bacterium]
MGRPRKNVDEKIQCLYCGKQSERQNFYDSISIQYKANSKLPYCQDCLNKIYQNYVNEFTKLNPESSGKKAMQRFCMSFDLFYSEKIYESALAEYEKRGADTHNFVSFYIKHIRLNPYNKMNYNATISNQLKELKDMEKSMSLFKEDDIKTKQIVNKASKFFGKGFSEEDYVYLWNQYTDWTSRHECQTKAQEEMFKNICFSQLEKLKRQVCGDDTKDIDTTLLKQLEAAKLQPKQNISSGNADVQTFGTLVDKWETTRPIPEIDEELKDVDKIGLYLDTFFKGHLAKSMGLKNGLSRLYDKYMERYTVKKPEYNDDEDGEALFDAIFGANINDD